MYKRVGNGEVVLEDLNWVDPSPTTVNGLAGDTTETGTNEVGGAPNAKEKRRVR